jgi:hypothetical protein
MFNFELICKFKLLSKIRVYWFLLFFYSFCYSFFNEQYILEPPAFGMNELEQLESLNLIAKVCTELETHIGINDKVLGKFNDPFVLYVLNLL